VKERGPAGERKPRKKREGSREKDVDEREESSKSKGKASTLLDEKNMRRDQAGTLPSGTLQKRTGASS